MVSAITVAGLRRGNRNRARAFSWDLVTLEVSMGRGLLLWLIGIPIPIILIVWLLGGLHG
jgi:hypothetical protein